MTDWTTLADIGTAAGTLILAGASAAVMLALYHPGLDPTRVYEGTDTRAAGLLIGAALAMTWSSRRAARVGSELSVAGHARPRSRRAPRIALDIASAAGMAGILLMIWRTGEYSAFLYRGGLVVLSFATAAVIAAAATPGTITGRVLGWTPMRWLGVRSYGIYLWHYPVIVLTTPANATENLARAAWQTAVTIVISAVSWQYIESPIRRGALGRLWKQLRSADWRTRTTRQATLAARGTAVAAVAGGAAVLLVACAGLTGAVQAPAGGGDSGSSLAAGSSLPSPPAGSSGGAAPAASVAPSRLRTSCQAIAHIGDSTSEGMVSATYLANPAQRLTAQYQDVGVKTVETDISGARSVVETLPGQTNGYQAAQALTSHGFKGCWVLALGTNDTADVAIGSPSTRMQRIQQMMSAAHGQPVMWVNVISLLNSGDYSEANMQLWDQTLQQACSKYKNMRIFNWASIAQPSWFINDGIHYTPAGYAVRAQQIAEALARAFPAKGRSSGCTVS